MDALIGHGGHTSETDGGYYNAENESKQVANHLISFRLINGWIMTEPEDLATIQEYLTLPYGQIGYNTNTMIPGKLTGFPHNHSLGSLHGPVVPTTLSPQHGFGGLYQGDDLLYHGMDYDRTTEDGKQPRNS